MIPRATLAYFWILLGSALAADPVFSPVNLVDSAGNTADNDSVITWGELPASTPYATGTQERLSEGLASFYNMMHGFVDFVFLKGIPTDLVEKAATGNIADIPSNYSQYTSYFIGYGIAVAIGILFMIIFPIVGCCFCCCRCCCGKCGGKMDQSEKEAANSCQKSAYVIIVAIVLIFLLTGAVCIYVNNDNTSQALSDIPDMTNKNLDDIRAYADNTVEQVKHIAVTNFDFLKDVLFRDLDNVAYLVGVPLRTNIESQTGIRTTLSNAYTLSSGIDAADTALTDVETKVTEMNSSLTALNTALTNWKTDLDNVFTTCGGSCTSQPNYSVDNGVDSTQLPDLSSARTSMDTVTSTNLTEKIIDAEAELDTVPEIVYNESLSTITSLKTTIGDLSDDINPVVDEVNNIQDLIKGENATIDLDSLSADVADFGDLLEKYDKYRWQGGVGLTCIVLLVIVLAAFGLLFGLLGSCNNTPPSKRGFVSNLGGICLMASVGFVFIFSVLLMLLTTLTFMLGAPLHAFVCKPLSDLDTLDELWTVYNDAKVGQGNYYLGDVIHKNKSMPLTLTGILKECKADTSAMTAFRLDSKFDLNDLLNYSKTLDVDAEIAAISVDLTTINVYPADLQTQLSNAKDALNIDFTAFYSELNNDATTMDLSALAQDLDDYADTLTDPTAKTQIKIEANALRAIESTEYAAVVSDVAALNTSVANLEAAVAGIPAQIDSLDSGLTDTNTYIQNNGSDAVKTSLTSFANRLIGTVDSFKDFALDTIQNKMGSCLPVWNFYNSMLVYTFCYNILDTLNGFWFSLGWCIFFFMPGIICSVKLARYFRRMNDTSSNRVSPAPGEKVRYPYDEPPINRQFNAAQFASVANEREATTTESVNGEPATLSPDFTNTPLAYNGDAHYTRTTPAYVDSSQVNESFDAPPPSKDQLYGNTQPEVALEMEGGEQQHDNPGSTPEDTNSTTDNTHTSEGGDLHETDSNKTNAVEIPSMVGDDLQAIDVKEEIEVKSPFFKVDDGDDLLAINVNEETAVENPSIESNMASPEPTLPAQNDDISEGNTFENVDESEDAVHAISDRGQQHTIDAENIASNDELTIVDN